STSCRLPWGLLFSYSHGRLHSSIYTLRARRATHSAMDWTFQHCEFSLDTQQPSLSALIFRAGLIATCFLTLPVQCISEADRLDFLVQGSNFGFAHGSLCRKHTASCSGV